jgi:hypothetical protein
MKSHTAELPVENAQNTDADIINWDKKSLIAVFIKYGPTFLPRLASEQAPYLHTFMADTSSYSMWLLDFVNAFQSSIIRPDPFCAQRFRRLL